MASIFNEARQAASATKFKASASELLGVYPVVRYFVETVLHSSDIVAEMSSFFKLCRVLDLVKEATVVLLQRL